MGSDHKQRWVFGPVVEGVHACRDYAIQHAYFHVQDGHALAHCTMNAHQLAAARRDPRLTVLPSLHAAEAIPDHVADHHAAHGVSRGMRLHDALTRLAAEVHPNFEPEF